MESRHQATEIPVPQANPEAAPDAPQAESVPLIFLSADETAGVCDPNGECY
jgi:hypothetical protein